MLNKKAAIELSINFFVILIISIVLFGFGVIFIKNLGSQATNLKNIAVTQLDASIGDLVCEISDRVCISQNRKTIKRGNYDVFGMKIINILDSRNFDITITRPNPSGYTIDNKEIPSDNLTAYPERRLDEPLKKNEDRKFAVGIEVPLSAVPGTYVFNVEIKHTADDGSYSLYSAVQKLYVEVPK